MKNFYIRKSSKKICKCGNVSHDIYSILENKIVKALFCEKCYDIYIPALKGCRMILLSTNPNPVLPKFLKRIEDENKAA